MAFGSSDKLYEIDDTLGITTRPESTGGTPADRMIHRESDQYLILVRACTSRQWKKVSTT